MKSYVNILLGVVSAIILVIGFGLSNISLSEEVLNYCGITLMVIGVFLFGVFILEIKDRPINLKNKSLFYLVCAVGFIFAIITNAVKIIRSNFLLKENILSYLLVILYLSMTYYCVREAYRIIRQNSNN